MTPARRRVISVSAVVAILTVAAAICGAAMHAGKGMGRIKDNATGVQQNKLDLDAHEEQDREDRNETEAWRREMESVGAKTSTDVEWIRKTMEREHP